MDIRNLYAHIGKLLYTVSDIDGVVSAREKERLHELVRDRLVKFETNMDGFGTNSAWYAEMSFDYHDYTESDPDQTYQSFIDFIKIHRKDIDPELRSLMFDLASDIANAYYKLNAKERTLLRELLQSLKHI